MVDLLDQNGSIVSLPPSQVGIKIERKRFAATVDIVERKSAMATKCEISATSRSGVLFCTSAIPFSSCRTASK